MVKNLPANAGDARDAVSIPGSGRCPGVGHGTPVPFSILAWKIPWQRNLAATVHGAAKSQTQLRYSSSRALPSTLCGRGIFHREIMILKFQHNKGD